MKHRKVQAGLLIASMAFAWAGVPAYAQSAIESQQDRSPPETTLQEVKVTDKAESDARTPYAGGQVNKGANLGILGDSNVMDTPFNQISYTSEFIEDKQARSIADVLTSDPSVRMGSARSNIQEQFSIRGTNFASQDIAFNGMYGLTPYWRTPVEIAESIEVLRGASALLNGMAPSGNVAGAINIVPKRATDDPLTRVTVSYLSDAQLGTHVDVGRRFGNNNAWGIRFNGMFRNGDTVVEEQRERDGLGALGVDYRGERLRASLDLIYQEQKITNQVRQFTLAATATRVPVAPDNNLNYPGYGYVKSQDTVVASRVEYDINDNVTVHAGLGRRYNEMDAIAGNMSNLDQNGNYGSTITPAWQNYNPTTTSFETGINAKFETGPIKHKIAASVSNLRSDEKIGFVIAMAGFAGRNNNIYNPINYDTPSTASVNASSIKPRDYLLITLRSYALADTLSFLDDKVQLTVGARHQTVKVDRSAEAMMYLYPNTPFTPVNGTASKYDESAVTPVVGLVVRPSDNLSLYANYVEGLSEGARSLPPAVPQAIMLPPAKSRQTEAGVKYDLGALMASASVFRIKRPGTSAGVAALVGGSLVSIGDQVTNGLELNVAGEVVKDVRILGGVTFMSSKYKNMSNAAIEGNEGIGVPNVQTSLGVDWDNVFVSGLGFNARMVHTGTQYVDQANNYEIPSVTTFDIGARYKTKVADKDLTLRLSIENLFDRDYWAISSSTGNADTTGFLYVGTARTVLLSGTVDF